MIMHNPAHPGKMLKEGWLTPLGISVTSAAKALGITQKHLSNIVNGRASITPDMAKRFEAFTGNTAQSWLAMQANFDLWKLKDTVYDIEKVA